MYVRWLFTIYFRFSLASVDRRKSIRVIRVTNMLLSRLRSWFGANPHLERARSRSKFADQWGLFSVTMQRRWILERSKSLHRLKIIVPWFPAIFSSQSLVKFQPFFEDSLSVFLFKAGASRLATAWLTLDSLHTAYYFIFIIYRITVWQPGSIDLP